MTTPYDEAAVAALRERQGAGARYDSDNAPAKQLAWARSGTAYFLRQLNELTNAELTEPSLLDGWTRAHVISHVGYNARALTRLTEWARTGVEIPMYASPEIRGQEIENGATLPPRALRHLIDHSAVHLNVEWRDLTDEQWDNEIVTAQGRTVPVRFTGWMRTREVWIHAVDLGGTGSFIDFPPELLDELLDDVVAAWTRRDEVPNVVFHAADRPEGSNQYGATDAPGAAVVRGRMADLVRWATGRGARRLEYDGDLPELPRWL